MTSRWFTPWLYLLVPLALLVTFTYLPVADMVSYSFTDWDGLSPASDFVGLDNYLDLFTRPELFQVFTVSLCYLAGSVVQIGAALYFGTVLSFKQRLLHPVPLPARRHPRHDLHLAVPVQGPVRGALGGHLGRRGAGDHPQSGRVPGLAAIRLQRTVGRRRQVRGQR